MEKQKQVIGIDVSKNTLAVCLGSKRSNGTIHYKKSETVKNSLEGFKRIDEMVSHHLEDSENTWYVMEATGVYYETLAYYLFEHNKNVCVLLPNKTKHYAKSLVIKSKTDKIDAKMLVSIGLERSLQKWNVPTPLMSELKELTREYRNNKSKTAQIKNQIHAKEHAFKASKSSLKRLNAQVKFYEKQLKEIERELKTIVQKNELLRDKIKNIETIPAVSFLTILSVVSETNGFALIENAKQLVSYAGMDIMHNESGTITKKTKISKKGNRFIRSAMHMPALCAIQYNEDLKSFYLKLIERKQVKKIGVTAVSRKLLILIFTLWKNDTEYVNNYKMAA